MCVHMCVCRWNTDAWARCYACTDNQYRNVTCVKIIDKVTGKRERESPLIISLFTSVGLVGLLKLLGLFS